MIINIPINIDEHIFEEKIQRDYDKIITQEIIKTIESALCSDRRRWNSTARPEDEMREIINNKVDLYLKEYKDEIIAQAAEILAKRVQRTKKAKEVLTDG